MKDYISYVSKNKFLGLLIILIAVSILVNSALHVRHTYRVNAKSKSHVLYNHKLVLTTKLMSASNNHRMTPKRKVIRLGRIHRKHRRVVKSKSRWRSLGIKRITYYCAGCNFPRGSHRSASGVRLRTGHVAMNGVKLGSTIKLGRHIYKVVDRVGRSNTVDIFRDTTRCRCQGLSYKKVQILV